MTLLHIKSLYLLVFPSHALAVITISSLKKPSELLKKSHPSRNTSDYYFFDATLPIVINTWPFVEAGMKAWEVLSNGGSALDAVEQGCSMCEQLQCDGTVGYGGSPDENGETALDAMIMDGESHDVGAVGALRRVKNAISVARAVLKHTQHTLLVGSQATDFALMMGFTEENLTTPKSESIYADWKTADCQPNFWTNVLPDPSTSCGPYIPAPSEGRAGRDALRAAQRPRLPVDRYSHDTIGMIAIDSVGRIAGGTSTNGASHKIPGRIGDSPVPGSGTYVDKKIGGAAATGDGDVMMRFMPSLLAVEGMRRGLSPDDAADLALQRIVEYYPAFSGAVVTLNLRGEFGAACSNLPESIFRFTVGNASDGVHVQSVSCLELGRASNTATRRE